MKNLSEYICHKNNRNAEKKCASGYENLEKNEGGYRELFERVGTGVLWIPGGESAIYLWKETKENMHVVNRLTRTGQKTVPPF